MKTTRLIRFFLSTLAATFLLPGRVAAQIPPVNAATQTQVNAGTLYQGFYVSPLTLKNYTGSLSANTWTLSISGQMPLSVSGSTTLRLAAGSGIALTLSGTTLSVSASGGSNAINLLITGSASPAANSASFSVPSGMVLTLSGSTPVTLSMGTGLNTFAGGLSSSGVLNVTNATPATASTSGAVIVTGGIGVQGGVFSTTVSSGNITSSGTVAGLTGTFGSGGVTVTGNAGNGGGFLTVNDISTTYGAVIRLDNVFQITHYGTTSTAGLPIDGFVSVTDIGINVYGNNSTSAVVKTSGLWMFPRGLTSSGSFTASSGGTLTGTFAGTKTFSGATVINTSSNITSSGTIAGGTIAGSSVTTSGAVTAGSVTTSGALNAGTSTLGTTTVSAIFFITPTVVGSLPSGVAGQQAIVTDSLLNVATGIGTVVQNGGDKIVPVYFDGSNWIIY